jgi:hypothetical protein
LFKTGFPFQPCLVSIFPSDTNASGKSFPETGKFFPFAMQSFFKFQCITALIKSVVSVKRGLMNRNGQNRILPFSWFFNCLTKKGVKMRVKMGTVVPKMGTFVHLVEEPTDYRTAIAMALHDELDDTHRAIKIAMRWTGASERTVKYWFSGERGPSGDHLIALARHSDAVLYVVLALAGRHVVEEAND